jgi:hypothetical protein
MFACDIGHHLGVFHHGTMANNVRSAKSSNNWRSRELSDLNLRIEIVDAPSFSGSVLHDPQTDPTLLVHPVLTENLTHPSCILPSPRGSQRKIASFSDTSGTPLALSPSVRLQTAPSTTLLRFCYQCWSMMTNPSASFIWAWNST